MKADSPAPADEKVVGIRPGLELRPLGIPNQEIIEEIQRLLAEAESGQIQGFFYGSVDTLDRLETEFLGGRTERQLAGCARLAHRINLFLDEE